MRKSVVVGVLAAGMLFAGCAAQTPEVEVSQPPAPSASPTPSAVADDAAAPQECVDYVGPEAPGSEALQALALNAELPPGVVLNPGLQVINSTSEAGKVEVVARVCSDGLDDAELVDVGNAIAGALYADPAHETITTLVVSSLVPSGEYLDSDPGVDSITTDYELYLWDDPRPSNWTR